MYKNVKKIVQYKKIEIGTRRNDLSWIRPTKSRFKKSRRSRHAEKKGEVARHIVCVLLVDGESVEDKLKTLNSCNSCERDKKNQNAWIHR